MSKKTTAPDCIRLRGARQNNLKNFDLDVPLGKLVVICGLSGSGKSSLAFETLFAEGQRRYIETFSPYARQFLDRMDKPRVRRIEGIPPGIAIEQRNSVKSTRSTVGTMTEITDYAKVIWAGLAQLHCRGCGKWVAPEPPSKIWETMRALAPDEEALVTFNLELSRKFSVEESLALIAAQGYRRLLFGGEVVAVEQALERLNATPLSALTVVQDRLKLKEANRARFIEACGQAYHFGKGKLAVAAAAPASDVKFQETRHFSSGRHCAACNIDYREPSAALFSFNHPVGACPTCKGFGRIISIDFGSALPDRSMTLAGGAVKPWQTKTGAECQADMMKFAKLRRVPCDVPFRDLPKKHQDWVIEGDPGYGADKAHEWPRAWYGVKGYFRWLESKSYKMHVRVLLARYRAYTPCADCGGTRFQPETLLYRVASPDGGNALTLADFYRLTVREALAFSRPLAAGRFRAKVSDPLKAALEETNSRLSYLLEAGLGYLSLDRQTRSLSGGETARVNLASCLGSRLVNTMFVLDEPSVGLHARDVGRLTGIAGKLRDAGNSVVVVEHEAGFMRAADQIIELGPGSGEAGGSVVFQGAFPEILRAPDSLTGQYLSGKKRMDEPARRAVFSRGKTTAAAAPALIVRGANLHNLKNLTVEIPLGRLVCVTGVSGSGKSTLVREVLLPALQERLAAAPTAPNHAEEETGGGPGESAADGPRSGGLALEGWESLGRVLAVDQSLLGRTPRSNPAVYIGAFDEIRALFAQTAGAEQRGLNASAFSFNSAQGQCERCRGAGFEKIEMQFLSDVFIRCPDCNGRRYRPHILEVTAEPRGHQAWNIADLLAATVDEAVGFLHGFDGLRAAARAAARLNLLREVGLGYLRLGQPINTLSGGESQRLKLVGQLQDSGDGGWGIAPGAKPSLFILDEPTTGLHFDDVRVLVGVFQRMVGAGHSVLVVEHNLDVIQSADWVMDLGPEGGGEGGRIVAEGAPGEVAAVRESHTGRALAEAAERAERRK